MTGGSATRLGPRSLRAGVLGGTSLLLAATAHLLAGGSLPSPAVLAVVAGVLGLVAVTVTARRVRLPGLTVLLGLEQLALHQVFGAAAAATCRPVAHHGPASVSCAPVTGAPADAPGLMLLAHLAAVLGTAWLLARGEAWLWRVADRVTGYATAAPSRRSPRPARLPVAAPRRPYGVVPVRRAAPRGPPGAPLPR